MMDSLALTGFASIDQQKWIWWLNIRRLMSEVTPIMLTCVFPPCVWPIESGVGWGVVLRRRVRPETQQKAVPAS